MQCRDPHPPLAPPCAVVLACVYVCVSRPVKSDLLLVNFGNSHPDREKVGRQAGRQALHKAMAGSLCMHASGASRLVDRVSQGVPGWQSISMLVVCIVLVRCGSTSASRRTRPSSSPPA